MSLTCPTCKADNKDGAKFCKECGGSFANLIPCPSCNALIKPGKFCASCGHSFVAAAPKSEAPTSPVVEAPQVERPPAVIQPQPSVIAAIAPETLPTIAAPIADPTPTTARPAPAPPQTPTAPAASSSSPSVGESSPPMGVLSANQQPNKTNAKVAYALIPLALVLALGGFYWWKSTQTENPTAAAPAAASTPAAVTPEVAAPPPPEPVAPQPPAVTTDPTPAPAMAPAPAPQKQEPEKQAPAKLPNVAVKPAPPEKRPAAEKPVAARPQVQAPAAPPAPVVEKQQPKTEPPKPAAPAKTLDEAYNDRITAECAQGFFPGMACREKIRWQMCDGKWSPDALPGQATCKGAGAK